MQKVKYLEQFVDMGLRSKEAKDHAKYCGNGKSNQYR